MAQRAIKRFVDVEIRKDTPRVSAAGFGIPLVLTDSSSLSSARRVRRFTSKESVADFFGANSEEYKVADAFFSQDQFLTNQPEEIQYGRFVDAASAALLECGDSPENDVDTWKTVTDGEFSVTVDGSLVNLTGLNFSSVTSLSDVASVITTGLGGSAVCYFLINRFNIQSATNGASSTITVLAPATSPSGTYIGGDDYLDGVDLNSTSDPGGAYISPGQVAEDFATALDAIEEVNNDWYALSGIKKYRDDTVTEDIADQIESRRKMFLIATNDANVLVLGSTSTTSYYIKNANYKRSATIYHDNVDLYPDLSWLGQQLPKPIGSTNWSYKTLAGIAEGADVNINPVELTEAQKDAALDVNCNLYTSTLGSDFTYFGTMGGGRNPDKDGEYIDIIRDIDFLQARVEEGLLSLFLERDTIPYTNGGISIVDNRLKGLLDEFGVAQGILVEGSVITSFPKRSEVSAIDRDDRFLPQGTFTGELQGAINTVVIRGTVFV